MKSYLIELKLLPLIVALTQYFMLYIGLRGQKGKNISHQREFMGSLVWMGGLFLFFDYGENGYKIISLLAWPWFLRSMTALYEDLSRQIIKTKDQIFLLEIIGGSSTIVAYFLSKNPIVFMTPFLLCMAYYAQSFIWKICGEIIKRPRPLSVSITFGLMILCLLDRFLYPFLNNSQALESYLPIITVSLITALQFAIQLSVSELNSQEHEKDFNFLLSEKTKLLMEQSKYTELGMMSAGITHEINNPLMVIQARATQLFRIHRDPIKVKEVSDGLEQILFMTERISRTIQGIREFIRPEKKNELEQISLKTIMDDVDSFCGQRFTNHGINLRFYDLERYSLFVNKIQIEQAILNLLNNSFDAIEYLPEKWIELSANETNDSIQIMIKDSGTGIQDETAKKMMEPFYTTKSTGKSTGIGLSLTKEIVESFGGRLTYLRQEPHTTFMIELPKIPNQMIQNANQSQLH